MIRYAHTNIIAKDPDLLIRFYKEALGCQSMGQTRDLRGDWLDRMTGVSGAHIVGEHLLLPGYGADHPTLEIFGYDPPVREPEHSVNGFGLAHMAFEVDQVGETLSRILEQGGKQVGELVTAKYEDGRQATFVYVRDPEGNILELQNWENPGK